MEKRGGIREGERLSRIFLFFSRFDARSEGGKKEETKEREIVFWKRKKKEKKIL